MKRKFVSFALATIMFVSAFSVIGTSSSFAQANNSDTLNQIEKQAIELDSRVDNNQYEKQIKELEKALKKVKDSAEAADMKDQGYRFNTQTIYDLDTIGIRLELFNEIGKTIRIASTELSNKVQEAHTEIGFEISKAVIVALNPMNGKGDIEEAIQRLKMCVENARTYPEVDLDSRATIYVKKKLRKAIWETRFTRDRKILGKVPFRVYRELNRNITKAVGVQLNQRSTVRDVDAAVESLQKALDVALSQARR